jgi:hypothetical protein
MKMMIAMAAGLLLTGSAAAQDAAGVASACPLPDFPAVERPSKPDRPALPSCINEARGTHTCNNRVLNAYEAANRDYQAAFNVYVAQVNSYLQKLQSYTRQAVAYAECERDVVLPSTVING